MISQRVTLIDQSRNVVATAQVAEQDSTFTGRIDLSLMPAMLQRQFEAYEEIVNNQMFSLLDEIEEKIGTLFLKVVFENGDEADLVDVQIYPSTKNVSFKMAKGVAHRNDNA